MRQQQQDGEQPAEQAGGAAGERALQAPAGRRDAPHAGAHRDRAVGPAHGPQGEQGEAGEHHRLHLRQGELAVELGGDDLGGHHPEAAAEHVGRGERGERRHEGEQRRAGERRPQQRQGHPVEGPPAAGAERSGRFEQRGVEPGEGGAGEQVEVDVHRVGVDEQDRPRPGQPPGRLVQTQQRLHGVRGEAALAVEEEEGDHPHQRRQGDRQGHDGAENPPAGEVGALEEEGERHAHQRRERHRGGRDPEAPPERQPLVAAVEEVGEVAEGPPRGPPSASRSVSSRG